MEKSGPQDKNASQKPLRHMTTELGRLLNANPDQSKERSAFKMNGPVEFYLSLGAGEVDSYIGTDVDFSVHVYQLHDEGVVEHHSDEEKSVMLAHHWSLPCREFEGIWDSLIFDEDIKTQLLEYVQSALLFSDRGVSADLVSWSRFRACRLVEINSHSLFSKWFSESGKMVQKMFQQIWEMAEDESTYVCVLIDEVESLAAARKAALAGGEPSDSIRAVNALLTQIDKLKQRKNVLILATSNMTEAIDVAFADRADIKMYIGLPSHRAIYWMLRSGITELQRVNIIDDKTANSELQSFLDAVKSVVEHEKRLSLGL
ncbi:Pachytene checkpoint protein 2 [Lunasporangiospora selenospora]|uniref:Pachytene checkpoint protein 2 n=1 Tax=Lunasporangiospora selenospora TaxID=979761 RepID=A0A9P6FX04_9FUNG|nr:Pachytene checkpoint protein 2 [Lunasporangiospora selenospora]